MDAERDGRRGNVHGSPEWGWWHYWKGEKDQDRGPKVTAGDSWGQLWTAVNGAPAFSMHRKYVCMYIHAALRCAALLPAAAVCVCTDASPLGRGRQKQPLSNDKR